ncbi:hypothetical protein KM043_011197 [Ampulex compressa]|nr:hypothetical protein KM043_011197 [Ampulex compressa]
MTERKAGYLAVLQKSPGTCRKKGLDIYPAERNVFIGQEQDRSQGVESNGESTVSYFTAVLAIEMCQLLWREGAFASAGYWSGIEFLNRRFERNDIIRRPGKKRAGVPL